MNKIRIMLIDDEALMREGLKIILENDEQLQVIAEARDGFEAISIIEQMINQRGEVKPFDIALVDIRMPNLNGVETVKSIKQIFPEAVLIMLTTFDDEQYIVDALHHGAIGYLLKDMSKDKLIIAIKDAVAGELILSSKVAVKLANFSKEKSFAEDRHLPKKDTPLFNLTEREEELARLLSKGFTNKQISQALYISEGTVKNHVSNLYSKIEIYDRTSAALFLKECFKD